jgi:hypothetical protein
MIRYPAINWIIIIPFVWHPSSTVLHILRGYSCIEAHDFKSSNVTIALISIEDPLQSAGRI